MLPVAQAVALAYVDTEISPGVVMYFVQVFNVATMGLGKEDVLVNAVVQAPSV